MVLILLKKIKVMSKRHGPNKENLEETRQVFIEKAMQEFTEHGFANASTNRIVEATGMARGSLYYHFKDKQGLFRAVFEHILLQAYEKLKPAAESAGDNHWEGIVRACEAYLDMCKLKEFRKIVLIESQAALDFQDRMDIHRRTIRSVVHSRLQKISDEGRMHPDNIQSIAFAIYGSTGEMGRFLDSSENLEEDLARHKRITRGLMEQLAP